MAQHRFHEQHGFDSEIIVVDNASTDETAEIARKQGTIVTYDPERSIARARNTGARAAQGDVLVFVDADTIVPEEILTCIWQALEPPACLGGVVKPEYTPTKQFMRLYLATWRWYGQHRGLPTVGTESRKRNVGRKSSSNWCSRCRLIV